MTPLILAFPGMEALANQIARRLGAETAPVDLHRFPDGESLVTLPEEMRGRAVILVATLREPDPLALPLRFAAATARELGARRVALVAPYLAYMRQDRRFAPGQAVNAPLFATFLQESFDWLVTVDPHLHRIPTLDRLFGIAAIRVRSAPLIADWIAHEVPDAVILGSDSESQQRVAEVARMAGRPREVPTKVRCGDRQVDVSVPESEALAHGTPVVLDDIASSGRTMIRAIERLIAAGPSGRSAPSSTQFLRAAHSRTSCPQGRHAWSRQTASRTQALPYRWSIHWPRPSNMRLLLGWVHRTTAIRTRNPNSRRS